MVRSKAPTLPIPVSVWKVPDVMSFLRVSRPEVYRLVREEGLRATVVGNAFTFHPADVASWLEKRLKID